ncbi:MAG: 3-oxo-tetronate 4-phosphate decarboxylase [Pseudomonadota bacterium]
MSASAAKDEEERWREEITRTARSLFERGWTHGSTGNISVRLSDGGWLMTPTGSSMGTLEPSRLSRLNAQGQHIAGDKPTKEAFLHTTMYAARPDAGAVVHLHSTHSVAVSCLAETNAEDCLPPMTAYYVMRVGRLPLVPYYPPGDPDLAQAVGKLAGRHHAMLLANHGPVVAGSSLSAASDAMEELEETARLFLMLRGERLKILTPEERETLRQRFGG